MSCVQEKIISLVIWGSAQLKESTLVLVELSALPDVFSKVLQAKRLLAQGKAKSYAEAARMCDISRNALYKYKDRVFERSDFFDMRIITLSAQLMDRPGVLSKLVNAISQTGANILTVNQNMAVDGVALVSVSVGVAKNSELAELIASLNEDEDIVSIKII